MPTPALHLELLGKPRLTLGGQPLTGLVSAKAQALLFYLAVTRQAHSREKLAGLLWSNLPEEKARQNLRVALTILRQFVPDHLETTRQSVACHPCWLDVQAFEQKLAPETWSISVAQEAVNLYRGDFMEDFALGGAPLFEEWALLERERLRQLALDTLHCLADAYLEEGAYATGISAARQALRLEPWREETHRLLMRLLACSGQRALALKQYETCRQVLAQELNAEVSLETSALYREIKAEAEGQKTPAALSSLPASLTSFVGREAELARLVELLRDDDCRLLTLTGAGGIGKTRLALEAARQFLPPAEMLFREGVFFVPLEEVTSAALLVPALAEALRLALAERRDPLEQLCAFLRPKALLLVLDSFEHLVSSAGALIEILRAAPAVKLLATSREALNLYEEWVFPVEGLPLPPAGIGVEVEQNSAVQLFAQRARRAHLGFSLQHELRAVARICRLVEGMPLGIELAASRTRTLSCEAIAGAIAHTLDALSVTYLDLPPRHRSLRAVFEHSWDLLAEPEQAVLARLSALRGDFDFAAAGALAGANVRILSALTERSLLRRTLAGRYEMHELLRQFCAEKLAAAGKQDERFQPVARAGRISEDVR